MSLKRDLNPRPPIYEAGMLISVDVQIISKPFHNEQS